MKVRDARFTCPNCSRVIELHPVKGNPPISEVPLAAVCQGCKRVYTAEQWRDFYGPGGRSGEGPGESYAEAS